MGTAGIPSLGNVAKGLLKRALCQVRNTGGDPGIVCVMLHDACFGQVGRQLLHCRKTLTAVTGQSKEAAEAAPDALPSHTTAARAAFIPFASSQGGLQTANLPILRGMNGVLRPGTVTLLLGPPGAGKTVFLQTLAGRMQGKSGVRVRAGRGLGPGGRTQALCHVASSVQAVLVSTAGLPSPPPLSAGVWLHQVQRPARQRVCGAAHGGVRGPAGLPHPQPDLPGDVPVLARVSGCGVRKGGAQAVEQQGGWGKSCGCIGM